MVFNTSLTTKSEKDIKPGDLVIVSGRLCVALNRTKRGYLLKDCNSDAPVYLEKNQNVEVAKAICIAAS